jgi:mRNA deadenylase 3'-5' endonuclease subunit Ccr4
MQNILAQDYARPEKYPWVKDLECLKWEHRRNLIVNHLLDEKVVRADIVCLQEVQRDHFPDLLSNLLPTFGGILQNVSRTHNVGTAILVRKTCPFRIKRVESRSRALIAVLENKYKSNLLYVCAVHLDADKAWDKKTREFHQRQRENQLKSLLKRLEHQCNVDKYDIENAPIIIAGDFNMLRNNPINSALSDGELSQGPCIQLRDAYLDSERRNRCSLSLYPEKSQSGRNLVKTYRGGAVLDYIFVSNQVQVRNTLLCHPSSSSMGMERWPSKEHPSDHLPVGIDFEWN